MKTRKVIFRKVQIHYTGSLSGPALGLLTAFAMLLEVTLNLGDKAVEIVAEEMGVFSASIKRRLNSLLK